MTNRGLVFGLTILCLSVGGKAWADDRTAEARAIYDKAASVSNLRTAGSKSFELRADVEITAAGGKTTGTYHLSWNDPRQWREELVLPEYRQLQVVNGEHGWRVHPKGIFFIPLSRAIHLLRLIPAKLDPDNRVKTIKEREVGGRPATCVEYAKFGIQYCFDIASGVLVLSSSFGETKYSNYTAFQGRLVPRTIVEKGKDLEITIQLRDIAVLNNPDPKLFEEPAGAEEWKTCDDPEHPKAIQTPEPEYPQAMRLAKTEGFVQVAVTVDISGRPTDVMVVQSSPPGFELAARNAVSSWKFHPAMCGNTAVPFQTTVEINFRLY